MQKFVFLIAQKEILKSGNIRLFSPMTTYGWSWEEPLPIDAALNFPPMLNRQVNSI